MNGRTAVAETASRALRAAYVHRDCCRQCDCSELPADSRRRRRLSERPVVCR